ncbi:chemotaxis protein CheW [Methylococcus sp. EFPC2]|uniref:chemotaxis protein CheW n=1 Tax=Methylococcus sp. EFPC2 TaxID=2812648 RepID=UPI0019670C79|nr:chemotaxis protein CheW [Methylococcus sp. EFPC2]QSA98691.1 chemotaxis protein CheW [Methylococcus sp. EFPC2]
MSIELSEFYQTFFDEASEHLDTMESLLLELDVEAPDLDHLNAIFRSAHSIKGGSGMFGFNDMTEVTHILETLLDRLRKGELQLREEMVEAFLHATDVLKGMVAARQGAAPVEEDVIKGISEKLHLLSQDRPAAASAADGSMADAAAPDAYDIRFSRVGNPLGDPAPFDFLIDTLKSLGTLEVLDQGAQAHFRITQPSSVDEVREAFAFFVQPEQYEISPVGAAEPGQSAQAAHPQPLPSVETVSTEHTEEGKDFGFFVDVTPPVQSVASSPAASPAVKTEPGKVQESAPAKKTEAVKVQPAAHADTSIRVNIEKVDQLINLAGELVITQAMLKQTASRIDPVLHESLHEGIAQLERNTRDLQEAVMSIRMMPMSFVFSRFPRMVRDLAGKLKKEVNFRTQGEATELDKGLIEKITDPLTHLVRNSLDHGIEMPEERIAKGKDPKGNLTLRAFHQGGNVVIEVQDDGAGLDRAKLLAKARERGLNVSDAMTDQEVWGLIMAPGFSTAEVITDVSGRGVGMDVVKRNIESLGGRVEIDSVYGAGTTMTIRLPLTLAILDGLSIAVGSETFIIPLTSIIESLQPKAEDVKSVVGEGRVVHVRGEYLPLVALYQIFKIRPRTRKPERGTLMIVEADGVRAALLVDELLGQHQVVIKSLESNYRKVPGISGATIMGDGRVALIIDITGMVRLSKNFAAGTTLDDDEEEELQPEREQGVAETVSRESESQWAGALGA